MEYKDANDDDSFTLFWFDLDVEVVNSVSRLFGLCLLDEEFLKHGQMRLRMRSMMNEVRVKDSLTILKERK